MKVLKVLRKIFFGTYARGFFSSYLIAIMIGAIFLSLPVSLQNGVSLSPIDALFTAASALSVTGLTTIVVAETFSLFGILILLVIIQFGGIGLTMMVALFWLVARRKIGFKQRNMIMVDQNQLSRQGIVRFIRNVIIVIFTIEAIAFIVIANYLYFSGHFPHLSEALLQALFLTISLFTNAGFDIAPMNDSFQMFASDFFMQSIGILLIFMGSVGFWVLAEFKEFLSAKLHKEKFHFSYFVKFIFVLHVFFLILGAVLIIALDSGHFFKDKTLLETIFYGMFMSVTTRNAGFSTMDVNHFNVTTQMMLMVWMFIGASPNSVGGGVRTTTIILVLLALRGFARGKQQVIIMGRKIKDETVHKSLVALVAALLVIILGVTVLSLAETQHSMQAIVFEVTSAFGTTGLSMGITETISVISKLVLIMIMFIGRLGILALLLMFRSETSLESGVNYPEADVIVG